MLPRIPDPLLDTLAGVASFRGRFQTLTGIERMLTTIRHKEPDRVPVSPILCAGARQISGITFPDYALNAEKTAQVFLDGYEFVGGDAIVLLLDLSVEAADFGLTPDEYFAKVGAQHPIGFIGEPIDIAYLDLYLASDESRWVTGAEFTIDGGWTAQ